MGVWCGCSSPPLWRTGEDEPRFPWSVHGVPLEQHFSLLVRGSSCFPRAEDDPWISFSLISQTLTDQCPGLFAPHQGLCFCPGTYSLFTRPGIIFSKVPGKSLLLCHYWAQDKGRTNFLAFTTLNVLYVHQHAPAVLPISEVCLFLFQPQRILQAYFTHKNQDIKITNPDCGTGVKQWWLLRGISSTCPS